MAKTTADQERVDYFSVDIPDPEEKPYKKWDYGERRAFLIQQMIKLGGPRRICKTDMALVFGKSKQTLSKDMNICRAYLGRNINPSYALSQVAVSFEATVAKMQEEGAKDKEIYEFTKEHVGFLQSIGVIERPSDKVEHELAFTGPVQFIVEAVESVDRGNKKEKDDDSHDKTKQKK